MKRCTITDEPKIEGDAVVVRVIHQDPNLEDSGRVFVCRMRGFDDVTVEPFPRGQTPHEEGTYRAEAAEAAKAYADENLDRFEELFEELARRQAHASE